VLGTLGDAPMVYDLEEQLQIVQVIGHVNPCPPLVLDT